MDLSPIRFERAGEARLPTDMAVLMVGVAARQAASRTAAAQAGIERPEAAPAPFGSAAGRFNARVARSLSDWKEE